MRNVVVTGGSRGIGLGIARNLSKAGYRVIAIARQMNDQLASAMQDAEQSQQGAIQFQPFDLGNINGIAGLIQAVRSDFGPIYGLVNNAAIGTDGVLAIMHNSQIEQQVRVNTISPIVLTK